MFHRDLQFSGPVVRVLQMIGVSLTVWRLDALVCFRPLCRNRGAGGDHDRFAQALLLVQPFRLLGGLRLVLPTLWADARIAAVMQEFKDVPFETFLAAVVLSSLDNLSDGFVIDVRSQDYSCKLAINAKGDLYDDRISVSVNNLAFIKARSERRMDKK